MSEKGGRAGYNLGRTVQKTDTSGMPQKPQEVSKRRSEWKRKKLKKENFVESKEFKKAKADNLSTYKKAKEHPVEREDAGYNYLMASGPSEAKAFKEYRKRTAQTRDKAKSGRPNYSSGGVVLKGKKVGCQIK